MEQTLTIKNPHNRSTYKDLPSTFGIYIFKRGSEILYIGKSVNIKARVLSHVENARNDQKEEAIISQSTSLTTIAAETEFKALLLESQLIQKHHPKYNIIWRDDRSYLYIKITDEKYPKIYPVRKENEKKALYFGPFSSSRQVEYLLHTIRKIVPYCSQRNISKKACFYSKIGQCHPCPNYIESLADDAKRSSLRRKYRQNIKRIISILNGNTDIILKSLYKDLQTSIRREEFERGIDLRRKIAVLEHLLHNRTFDQKPLYEVGESVRNTDALEDLLKEFYPGITKIQRIECYDISNLMQKQATASMVVFIEGLADKREYRRFKIRNTKLQSDFDMLDEVVTRRFKNSWPHPSLIVIDGGRPQIKRIVEVLKREKVNVPVIGIAKHPDRLIIGTRDLPVIRPRNNHPGFRLIQNARDESHRFARKYHLFLRESRLLYNIKQS